MLLIKKCYELCLEMNKSLSKDIANENIVLELIKDRPLTEEYITGHFNFKKAYHYV